MSKFLSLKEAYASCESKGYISPSEKIDKFQIEASIKIAEEDLAIAKYSAKTEHWNSAYKLHYDVLHELVEAFLSFDKVKTQNHQCLFACLCIKHPELEFSWEFFEKIRTKRNGINYYGQPVNKEDWKEVEIQFSLYFRSLKAEIEKRIKNASG